MGQNNNENEEIKQCERSTCVNSVCSAHRSKSVCSAQYSALKIFYTNADCLLNKFEEFRFRIQYSNCDIIAVTEVKPKNERYKLSVSELQIANYDIYENLSDVGRGIIMYVHKTLKSMKLNHVTIYKESL